jgi:NTP pyrophosphatase (non-canonical NTP hydrolase)
MTLDELQTKIRALTVGIEHPRVGSALALAEECGEVMKCVLDREYYGKDVTAALADEVGDVLVALTEVCERFGISLTKSAEQAVAKIARKAPAWRAELGDRLIRLRERMDG